MKYLLILTAALVTLFAAMRVSGQGRIVEMGITSAEMASYFQQHAGSQDIARVDHPNDIGLISGLTVGRKMAIFKTASQISQFLSTSANAIDIVGYNLEPGQANDPAELANPVAAAKNVQAIARQYGKLVAVGLTHDLTLQYGAAMAPFADIWVLQIQKAQNDPQMAAGFVNQMVPALTKANPAIKVFVQIRTDSQPAALASLVNGLGNVNVSILTQKSDVQDAINVASQFFGQGGQPVSRQPRLYGDRLPSKDGQWLLPTPTLHLGSTDDDHVRRGSINSWDLVAPKGTPVYAARAGIVEAAGCNLYESHQWPIMQGYGCAISIKHGNGVVSQYGHCDTGSIVVRAGQQVDEWSLLCAVGMTGQTSFGPHTHFTILSNGKPVRIDGIFDINRMLKYERLGNAVSTEVPVQIGVVGGSVVTGMQPVQQPARLWYAPFVDALAEMEPSERAAISFAIPIGIALLLWLTTGTLRVIVISVLASVIATITVLVMLAPLLASGQSTQPAAVISGDWEKSYEVTQGREGWKCTRDPVYTMGGVTQGTYNRWLAKHGMGRADVCQSLTKEQAKQIFYELFWLPVGADKMPFALALTVVDHYYNTGAVSHLLAQCGQDVACFNQARIADYKTKSNCNLYCTAWIARVNHLRKLTEGRS